MIRIISLLLFVLLLFVLISLAYLNADQVIFDYLFSKTEISLSILLLFSFLLGVVLSTLVYISPSSTRVGITAKYAGLFRTVPTDDDQGPTTADFMIESGAAKVFIIDDQSSYSTGLADIAATALEAGGVEVTRESVAQDVTDFSALVGTIADDTDWVYLPWQVAANGQLLICNMLAVVPIIMVDQF